MTSNVYNIPAGVSFVDAFAKGLWEDVGGDSFALSRYFILLPNRRGCASLRDAFLRLTDGSPVVLPRLQPLGEFDLDEIMVGFSGLAQESLDLPPAISPLKRKILLARAVHSAGQLTLGFDQAVSLAEELAVLLDDIQTHELGFEGLNDLAKDYSEHWNITLDFLKVLTEHWPKILSEQGVVDPAVRRNRLLTAQMKLWQSSPPDYPVIAAGSTGSIPVVRRLISAVAQLPQGRVVLPGLDGYLEDESWMVLSEDHPQYGLKKLIEALNIARSDVSLWPGTFFSGRQKLVSEALRPAETTENWQGLSLDKNSSRGLSRMDCATQQEEADVIALIMRETLETPEKTAALVTPDRKLAERVATALRRWDVDVDDSAGRPLSRTPIGNFLQLILECVLNDFAPVSLLALLKHPLTACGQDRGVFVKEVQRFEYKILRGPRPAPGFEGLFKAIENHDRIHREEKESFIHWVKSLQKILDPFLKIYSQSSLQCSSLLPLHIKIAEALAQTDDILGTERLWRGEDGEVAARFVNEFYQVAADIPPLTFEQYNALFTVLMRAVEVRSRYGAHPRLHILGQMEARLYTADIMILGGLNEETWPPSTKKDPWMSRSMRKDFCLPSHERSIGLAAHDFVQGLSVSDVILTRCETLDGKPTVPARWLLRLDTVLQAADLPSLTQGSDKWRTWVKKLDTPDNVIPWGRPAPKPALDVRPSQLSVTQIEKWMRDPYGLYAQKILKLNKLDAVDEDPSAADRGIILHDILEKFISQNMDVLPNDALEQLIALGQKTFFERAVPPKVYMYWWPRFVLMAEQFIKEEARWRMQAKPVALEVSGEINVDGFTLTAKADRIDKTVNGELVIVDYKTGAKPRTGDVKTGFSPQLPLESVIAEQGGFEGVLKSVVSRFCVWRISGGNPPVEIESFNSLSVRDTLSDTTKGIKHLVKSYRDPQTPYIALPHTGKEPAYNDYAHLERVKEWAVESGENS